MVYVARISSEYQVLHYRDQGANWPRLSRRASNAESGLIRAQAFRSDA